MESYIYNQNRYHLLTEEMRCFVRYYTSMSNRENAMVSKTKPEWTFLSNHGHVLVCIADDPWIRGRELAARIGITERAAQSIVADLVKDGYITRTRVGRRNHYEIGLDKPLRHSVEQPHSVGELLQLVADLHQMQH